MSLYLLPRPLRYVLAVADHGSIQAASRALGIAASAIDRHIRLLEDSSQSPLFDRLPRGMRLTAAGEAVVVMARRWQVDEGRLVTGLREMRGMEGGSVRVAAMDSLANGVLPALSAWLQKAHPRVHLAIDIVTPSDAARALDHGTVDLVVAFNLPQRRHQHRLWKADLPFGCAVAPAHPLAGRGGISLTDLADCPLASQSAILPIRQYIDARHTWFFSQNEPVLVTNSLQLLKAALVEGNLAMLTSELDVLPELQSGRLIFVPLREKGLRPQSISVVIDARRPLARIVRLVSERIAEQMQARLDMVRADKP